MSRPITPTPKLNAKESELFLKSVMSDSDKPLGLIPTPKLAEVQRIIRAQCNCKICTRARKFLIIIKNLSEEDQVFMRDILGSLYNAESDLEWYSTKHPRGVV